jgi:hypothetical protein
MGDVSGLHFGRHQRRRIELYRKERIRVQVIIKDRRFSLFSRIVISRIGVKLMFRLWVKILSLDYCIRTRTHQSIQCQNPRSRSTVDLDEFFSELGYID